MKRSLYLKHELIQNSYIFILLLVFLLFAVDLPTNLTVTEEILKGSSGSGAPYAELYQPQENLKGSGELLGSSIIPIYESPATGTRQLFLGEISLKLDEVFQYLEVLLLLYLSYTFYTLMRKKRRDFMGSLPVSKPMIFRYKWLAGAALIMGGFLFMTCFCGILTAGGAQETYVSLWQLSAALAGRWLVYLFLFTAGMVIFAFAGSVPVSLAACAAVYLCAEKLPRLLDAFSYVYLGYRGMGVTHIIGNSLRSMTNMYEFVQTEQDALSGYSIFFNAASPWQFWLNYGIWVILLLAGTAVLVILGGKIFGKNDFSKSYVYFKAKIKLPLAIWSLCGGLVLLTVLLWTDYQMAQPESVKDYYEANTYRFSLYDRGDTGGRKPERGRTVSLDEFPEDYAGDYLAELSYGTLLYSPGEYYYPSRSFVTVKKGLLFHYNKCRLGQLPGASGTVVFFMVCTAVVFLLPAAVRFAERKKRKGAGV